jgi:hypothetical protein
MKMAMTGPDLELIAHVERVLARGLVEGDEGERFGLALATVSANLETFRIVCTLLDHGGR